MYDVIPDIHGQSEKLKGGLGWLTGQPRLQTPNALCLDYSAGTVGPLVSYRVEPGQRVLSLDCLSVHK